MKIRTTKGYKYAISWVCLYDDTAFIEDENYIPSVTVCLIAELYDKTTDEVIESIRKWFKKNQ
jgi:hypothetical protein